MNFNDIEAIVKLKFKDIKKYAEGIAYEVEVRSGYLRKTEQYKRLEFNLSFALDDVESTAKDVRTTKSSANKDSVTVKGKAPSTLYVKKRNLMKQKPEMLGENIDKNEESLQKAKEAVGEKTSEYFNKTMN